MSLTANKIAVGMFGAAAGGFKSAIDSSLTAVGTTATVQLLLNTNASGLGTTEATTNAAFAQALVDRLLPTVTTAQRDSAKAAIESYMTANPGLSRAQVVVDAILYIDRLPSTDPLAAAATSFASRVSTADKSTSTSTTLADLQRIAAVGFDLTTSSTDNLVGVGSNAEVFKGTVANLGGTLQATDKVAGGAGADTLELSMDIAFGGFSTGSVTGVETISLANTGSTSREFNATGVTGAKNFSIDATKGAVTLTGLPTGVESIAIKGQSGSTAGTAFSSAYAAGAAEQSSTTTAVRLDVDGVGTSTSARVTATLADVELLTVNAAGSNFLTIGGTAATTLNITGAGTLNSNIEGGSAIRTVDGSKATGALTLDLTGATPATTSAGFGSIATGTANDSITVAMEDLKANATINSGAGTDTVNLSNATATAQSTAYTLSGVETLAIGSAAAAGAMTFAANGWDAISTISIKGGNTSHTQSSVTVAGLGAKNITANVLGASATAATLSLDNSGTGVLNFKADGTAAKAGTGADAPAANVTFSEASSFTANVEAYAAPTTAVLLTASKATSVGLNVADGKNTAGTQLTAFYGDITAPEATSVTINSSGILGATGDPVVLTAGKATSIDITNAASGGFVTLTTNATATGGALKALSLKSNAALQVTNTAAQSKVQTLTIAADTGATTFATSSDFVSANVVTLSGSGTGSSVTLGTLGQTSNSYDLTVNASGTLRGTTSTHGITIGAIAVTAGKNVTLDMASVTGSINLSTIGDSTNKAGAVTIKAGLAGSFSGSNTTNPGFTVGNIESSGAVSIDAKAAKAASIGTISGDTVSVDISNVETASYTLGAISAKSAATVALSPLAAANTITVNSQSTSTALAVAVTGGIGIDTLVVNGTNTGLTSITLTGDLGAETDSVTVNGGASTATAKTISLAGLANYNAAFVQSGTGADTIIGGSGADTIVAGQGADTITGGGGADIFVFNLGDSTYSSPDRILDWGSTDKIQYGTAATVAVTSTPGTATATSGAGGIANAAGTIAVSSVGTATFTGTSSGYDTLAKKAGILSNLITSSGQFVFFEDSSKVYLFISDSVTSTTADVVIELVGVALPSSLPSHTGGTGAGSGLTGYSA